MGGRCTVGCGPARGRQPGTPRAGQALASLAGTPAARWRILHHGHCGGFARVSARLREFVLWTSFRVRSAFALDGVTVDGSDARYLDGGMVPLAVSEREIASVLRSRRKRPRSTKAPWT